jgi:hypothetical protein
MKLVLFVILAGLVCAGCSRNNDNEHTTATTVVSPPPRQVLRAEFRDAPAYRFDWNVLYGKKHDRAKPILIVDKRKDETYHEGEPVVIDFTVVGAKLKGDGGEYRVRYMVDDDDMQWIDRAGQVWLWGWLPGVHTLRIELIGPNGWPAPNGDFNIETREITIVK